MYTIKGSAEFIADLRQIDPRLNNIRLNSIEIQRDVCKVRYTFICDQAIDENLQQQILKEAEKITAPIFSVVEISVKKIVSNDQLINAEIYRFLSQNYISISIFLKNTDVISNVVGGVVKYTLRLTSDGAEYVNRNSILSKLNDHLSKMFCSDFMGAIDIKEEQETLSLLDDNVYKEEIEKIEHRTIKVQDVVVVDDENIGDLALYIEDAHQGDLTICGVVTDIQERKTKNDKPFLIINIDDTTAKMSGVYFSKKATYHKIKEITVGEAIIARGNMGEYNGRRSFTFDKINRCTFPKDFVKKDKYKKSAPKEYKLIFPSPAKDSIKVKSVFDIEEVLPQEVVNDTIVVFDFETTGVDYMNHGITEIGAVKLIGGKIVEQFTTLVKPDYHISEENSKITGITAEMVKDSPKIDAVIGDFIKFIDGATLVAHNADFDMKFLKRFAGASGYEIKNKVIDSLELARKVLPHLKHHDLHTVADNFSIVFHHHRALSDAYATAEAFIEMMKLKNA